MIKFWPKCNKIAITTNPQLQINISAFFSVRLQIILWKKKNWENFALPTVSNGHFKIQIIMCWENLLGTFFEYHSIVPKQKEKLKFMHEAFG